MKPILYEMDETEFTSNGICRLSDATSCLVTEERNGQFEVVLKYPVRGHHFNQLMTGRILYCTHDDSHDPQPFDIYKITKPNKGVVTVYGRHITYRLSKYVVAPVMVVDLYAQDMFTAIEDNIVGDCPFSFHSDLTQRGSMDVPRMATVRSLLGDDENCMLYCFGEGEYYWDHFDVHLLQSRGEDTGVKIRRGKNVKLLTQEEDRQEVLTAVVPYWYGTDPSTGDDKYVDLPDKIIYAYDADQYPYQLTQPLDLSSVFEQPPTESEIRAAATEYLSRNINNTRQRANYAINMTSIATDDPALQALQKVRLCDLVTVQDPIIGINVKLRVCKTVYDTLHERYDKIEVGQMRRTLGYAMKMQNSTYYQQGDSNATKIKNLEKTSKKAGGANNVNGRFTVDNSDGTEFTVLDKDGTKFGNENAKQNVDIVGKLTVNGKEITGDGGGGGGGLPAGDPSCNIDVADEETDAIERHLVQIKNDEKSFSYIEAQVQKAKSGNAESYQVNIGKPFDTSTEAPEVDLDLHVNVGNEGKDFRALMRQYGTASFTGPNYEDGYSQMIYHQIRRHGIPAFEAMAGKRTNGNYKVYASTTRVGAGAVEVTTSATVQGEDTPADSDQLVTVRIGKEEAASSQTLMYGTVRVVDALLLRGGDGNTYYRITVDGDGNLKATEVTDAN